MVDGMQGRTVYHLHALRATAGRGLQTITGWLDHVAGLGCGGVLLTPIHESSSHGYDTVDAMRLDPRLGSDADFDAFAAACHERDLRLILDGVFNHAGREFNRPDLFDGRVWEGHDELPTLDHTRPETLDWAAAVATHWLDRGADGWRFDVAYSMPRPFLADLVTRIRAHRPEAFLFGEMIHGDYAGVVESTGLDGVTQYELFKAGWSACNDANLWELAWAVERHRAFAAAFTPVTFLGNHDVTRIESNLRDGAHLELLLAMLFTLPGLPCVYYGDEFGWRGEKRSGAGGDDEIRPPLPDQPAAHDLVDRHRHWIGFRRARPWIATAPVEVVDKANRRLVYRVGEATVTLDLDHGVALDGF